MGKAKPASLHPFSIDDSLIQLYVMPLDEELYAAHAAATLLAHTSHELPMAGKN
jgi:hypothetical protein